MATPETPFPQPALPDLAGPAAARRGGADRHPGVVGPAAERAGRGAGTRLLRRLRVGACRVAGHADPGGGGGHVRRVRSGDAHRGLRAARRGGVARRRARRPGRGCGRGPGAVRVGGEAARPGRPAARALDAVDGMGRPLFSALRGLPVPDSPHGRLWRAAELVREHRGDGHLAAVVAARHRHARDQRADRAVARLRRGGVQRHPRARAPSSWRPRWPSLEAQGLVADGALTRRAAPLATRSRPRPTARSGS